MMKSLKQSLKNKQLTLGSWVSIGHPSIVEVMASGRFDWLCLDLEHSTIDLTTAQIMISTIKANNMQALVRVSKNEEVIIKRVMDAGADGVIVPMVNSGADAKRAVEFVKYPPYGKRGVGLYRAQNYGTGFDEYKKWVHEESVVIAQVEHIDAVNNIEEILTTPGIDGIMIGPYDLSGSMGMPGEYERDEVKATIQKVVNLCKKSDKTLGFHVILPDHNKIEEKLNEGYTFLAFSMDFYFLGDKVRTEMEAVRNLSQK